MDEELIKEVEQHAVIYNRQKYFLNNSGPVQYETKDEAWNAIAIKLRTDVETCKKRWKYLRERYVQQLKQGVPPTFEHLSRPYLEKMKFLDQHIQPRKSYRNVSHFLSSPNAPIHDYMDSRSNGSIQNNTYTNSQDHLASIVKFEPEAFQNFPQSSNSTPSNNQHRSPPPSRHSSRPSPAHHHHNQPPSQHLNNSNTYSNDIRENDAHHIPSSSSSLKSPLSSPHGTDHHHEMTENIKRARLATNNILPARNEDLDSSDNDDVPMAARQQQQLQQQQQQQLDHSPSENDRRRISRTGIDTQYNANAANDLLYSIYQRYAPQTQVRCSEQLLGELVTSELLKMSKERRKIAQRRILEVLFFDD